MDNSTQIQERRGSQPGGQFILCTNKKRAHTQGEQSSRFPETPGPCIGNR